MKNIIIITIDECKASALSGYGNKYTNTPTSEFMKANGVQFNNAFTCHTKCVPSRACLLSGRYSHSEGHRTLPGFELRSDEYNIASFLKSKGYKTAMFGKNHTVEPHIQNDVFDYVSSYPERIAKKEMKPEDMPMDDPMHRAFYKGKYSDWLESQPNDVHFINEGIDFINKYKDDNFFLLYNLNMPHPVYYEMDDFIDEIKQLNPPLPPKEILENAPDTLRWYRQVYNLEMLTTEQWQKIQNAYYSMVSFIDNEVKRIIDTVTTLNLLDDTMIIYTSDHGDFAGEHGCSEKYDTMFYDCLVKIPLYIMAPDIKNKVDDRLVENIDIVPTILDFLGFNVPGHIHGKSLYDALKDKESAQKSYVFCEGGVENYSIENAPHYDSKECIRMKPTYYWKQVAAVDHKKSMQRSKMIRSKDYKLIYRLDGSKEFYDLNIDSHEIDNKADNPKYNSIILEMMEELLKWCIRTETEYPLIDNLFA